MRSDMVIQALISINMHFTSQMQFLLRYERTISFWGNSTPDHAHQRIRGYFYNEMRYINLRFTYLLTYLLTY